MTSTINKRCSLLSAIAILAASLLVQARQISERDLHVANGHFKRGMEALLGEQYDSAEQAFRAAVKIDPLYDAAFYGLGRSIWPPNGTTRR